jgi:secondary thiamine-phosphate synthase enzyme
MKILLQSFMQKEIIISSSKKNEIIDITNEVEKVVSESKVKDGLCNVYVPHATAAVIINENYDPNVMVDILESLSDLIPEGKWRHDSVDGNAAAHIKSAIIGPSENIPIKNGKLQLGTWQSLCFSEFDGPRSNRIIIVNIIGD